jgi:uroporphyrinogen decarboxylase
MTMTNKERFLRAVAGKDVDMLPVQCDFSASGLQKYLNSKGISNVSDLELLKFFDNHVLYAYMNGATLQMKTKNFNGAKIIFDEWGCGWDTSQDLFYCTHPLEDWEKLSTYKFPDPNAEGYLDYAQRLIRDYADKYIVTSYHFCCLFERAYILRGFENVLMDLADEDERIIELFDRITDFHIRLAKRYIRIGVNCGRIVDDYGSQNGMIMSPALWKKLIKPRLAKIYAVYKNAGIPVIHHSCGNITDIIEDLIEIGMDVLNPVQPKAMDVKQLSERFGTRLTFFGGVCNQEIIPYRTREEIDSNVKYLVETLGKHGRYIIAPSNGIGPDAPLQNVEHFYSAAQKYRRIK